MSHDSTRHLPLAAAREAAAAAAADLAQIGGQPLRMRRMFVGAMKHWSWEIAERPGLAGRAGVARFEPAGAELTKILDFWADRHDIRLCDVRQGMLRMGGAGSGPSATTLRAIGCAAVAGWTPSDPDEPSGRAEMDFPPVLPLEALAVDLTDGEGGLLRAPPGALSALEALESRLFRAALPPVLLALLEPALAGQHWRSVALERQDPWLVVVTGSPTAYQPGMAAWRLDDGAGWR